MMQSDAFLEFMARQGHRIVKTESCYWYDARQGFYFYFPYHRLITPDEDEIRRILWGEHCIGVRYFTPIEQFGKESYQIVCSDKNYDYSSIDADYARRQTRRGLENFKIQQLDFKELVNLGCPLDHDTLVRQGRVTPGQDQEKEWRLYCSSAQGLDGFESWGAFKDNDLAAFMITYQMEDYFTVLHHSSATRYLPLYPNNALVYYVTKLKLALPGVNAVYYGPESLDAPASLDKFKFRMGFRKMPMKQAIAFNPVIKPFIGRFAHTCIKQLSALRPNSDTFRKIEGVVRFYREAT